MSIMRILVKIYRINDSHDTVLSLYLLYSYNAKSAYLYWNVLLVITLVLYFKYLPKYRKTSHNMMKIVENQIWENMPVVHVDVGCKHHSHKHIMYQFLHLFGPLTHKPSCQVWTSGYCTNSSWAQHLNYPRFCLALDWIIVFQLW